MSKGKIYSLLEMPFTFSSNFLLDDSFLLKHTFQENDLFSNKASFFAVIHIKQHHLTNRDPNLLHHFLSASFYRYF